MKKALSSFILVAMAFSGFGASSAQAWWWSSKLDLNTIQGKYDVVIKPNMSLACPDSITVVYNAANATLDSEAFHFANIGRGSQDGAQSFDPDHAAFSEASVDTTLSSDFVTETQSNDTTSSDTSQFPLDPGPLDVQNPGSPGSMHLAASTDTITTSVKYNSKDHTLTKTVDIGGDNAGEDCTFALETN